MSVPGKRVEIEPRNFLERAANTSETDACAVASEVPQYKKPHLLTAQESCTHIHTEKMCGTPGMLYEAKSEADIVLTPKGTGSND